MLCTCVTFEHLTISNNNQAMLIEKIVYISKLNVKYVHRFQRRGRYTGVG